MPFEDWTFRKTEVRLQGHIELRMELYLKQTPVYTTLEWRLIRRELLTN